jgi:hypothetical protein
MVLQVPNVHWLPGQQGWPGKPQGMHVFWKTSQAVPPLHWPLQQAW